MQFVPTKLVFVPRFIVRLLLLASLGGLGVTAFAQASTQIFRCKDNFYTNDAAEAKSKGCSVVQNANVTVVLPSQFVSMAVPGGNFSKAEQLDHRNRNVAVPDNIQKFRESERKAILSEELRTAQLRREVVCGELGANGYPARQANETDARYAMRAEQVRNDCQRSQSDMEALNKELSRIQ